MEKLFTYDEAAEILRSCKRFVQELKYKGKLEVCKVGSKVLIPESSLQKYLDSVRK